MGGTYFNVSTEIFTLFSCSLSWSFCELGLLYTRAPTCLQQLTYCTYFHCAKSASPARLSARCQDSSLGMLSLSVAPSSLRTLLMFETSTFWKKGMNVEVYFVKTHLTINLGDAGEM